MKFRIKNFFFTAALLLLSSGCGVFTAPGEVSSDTYSPGKPESGDVPGLSLEQEAAKNHQDYYGPGVPVALVTDVSSGVNNSFNQAALKGLQTYAVGAGVSYSCYNVYADTPDACKNTILTAIENRAEIVVCAGAHFEKAVGSLQEEYGNISFLLLDGVPRDSSGKVIQAAENVHCITYREEEAGYLAGYMATLEGYRKFGFIGGEQLPSVERYGFGFLQGIDAAAHSLGVSNNIKVDYWYADTFSPNKDIEDMALGWYQDGTEIIFACGGALYQSVLFSAEACDGMMIGVDIDQSEFSRLFLTSAMKGIDSSIVIALDEFFANGRKWPDRLAGNTLAYGAKENCIGLPLLDDAWRFKKATQNEYLQLLARLKSGGISIDTELPLKTNITIVNHNAQEVSDS
ncbi:MAG: BMP family ABC transporter substrate-binding protein [Lachnospiraceae bacterium]|jgi:basic membrane protein A|nr:BMP family ABC transporter substrate-binding protein [Lachnospiraceae bacterium]